MSLRLRNSWKYVGNKRWDWEIFLEDDGSGEIDNIASVEYILHPTFPDPRRIVSNRKSKFKLKSNGWGVFWIKAFANTRSGEKIKLKHYLELHSDPKSGTTK